VLVLNSCVSGGGAGRSLVAYLQHADHSQMEIHVALPEPGVVACHLTHGEELHFIPELVERITRPPFPFPGEGAPAALRVAAGAAVLGLATMKVVGLCQSIRPDVLYCNHMLVKPVGAFVGALLGIPVVFHARNIHHDLWIEKRFYQRLAQFGVVHTVLCNSRASEAPYAEAVPHKTRVVPNFVDTRRFDRAHVEPRLRAELGLAEGTPVVGYAGRIVRWKGVDTLIQAFARVHARVPQAVLVVLGDNDAGPSTDLKAEYMSLAERLGVGDAVRFVGFREDVAPYMADFDVLVLPSRAPEPFGRVLVESLALGVPAIITAHGGAVEVVRHDQDGLWVPPGDAPAMATAIESLLVDDGRRRAFGEAGAAHVRAAFDGYRIAAEITRSLRAAAPPRPVAPVGEPPAVRAEGAGQAWSARQPPGTSPR
jgi:glycosyltransferase involved in cell wall biosynthesis